MAYRDHRNGSRYAPPRKLGGATRPSDAAEPASRPRPRRPRDRAPPARRVARSRCSAPTSDRPALAGRLQQQVAGGRHPAADDHAPPGRRPRPGWRAPTPSQSPTVANACRATWSPSCGARGDLPARRGRAEPSDAGPRRGPGAPAAGVLLPAAAPPALARPPVGHDLHVAELPGHPVGAAPAPGRRARPRRRCRCRGSTTTDDPARGRRRTPARPRPAQLASLSSTTAAPQRSTSRRAHRSSRHGRCGANSTRSPRRRRSRRRRARRRRAGARRRTVVDRARSARPRPGRGRPAGRASTAAPARAPRPGRRRPRRPAPWCRRRRRRCTPATA